MQRIREQNFVSSALSAMCQVYPLLQRLEDHCLREGTKSVRARGSICLRGTSVLWTQQGGCTCEPSKAMTAHKTRASGNQTKSQHGGTKWAQNSTSGELLATVGSSQHPLRKRVKGIQSWARREGSGIWGKLGKGSI